MLDPMTVRCEVCNQMDDVTPCQNCRTQGEADTAEAFREADATAKEAERDPDEVDAFYAEHNWNQMFGQW